MPNHKQHPLTPLGVIITLGIVYGDIGTSPLYVMRAIVGESVITQELIFGALSCIVWTLTLQASLKYIIFALTADNRGEGGIFALYSLIRKLSPKWVIFVAMVGCSALLADGIITPSISITSAVEGMEKISSGVPVVGIVIIILLGLFFFQQFGTSIIGKTFGPIMLFWFLMLATLGVSQIMHMPSILAVLNPMYAIKLILHYPQALILIGAVFLCVTGAEALYSDLGHCGKANVRVSWLLVKPALLLNYMGQGAWLMARAGGQLTKDQNPFFEIMPEWFLYSGIIIATMATIIASQAMITGSFSLINEAVKLKVWYRLHIIYPSEHRQQLYIPTINWMLCFGCIAVVLFFQESSNMEAAYGMAITLAMLSTTILLFIYWFRIRKTPLVIASFFLALFLVVETGFFYSNLQKIPHGAWVTLMVSGIFFMIMFIHYRASRIRSKSLKYYKLERFLPVFNDVINDTSIPKYASNIVYMINANRKDEIEASVIESIFKKQPKRADTYWFVNMHVADEPYACNYKITQIIEHKLTRVDFYLGYKMHPSANVLFRKVLEELEASHEISLENADPMLRRHDIKADFLYITIEKKFAFEDSLNTMDKVLIKGYELLNRLSVTAAEHFNLTSENLIVETYPIRFREHEAFNLTRIQ
ncbi:MAG: KUP/HAK/KT family potassium transporter [Saprospiraceae bacterium]